MDRPKRTGSQKHGRVLDRTELTATMPIESERLHRLLDYLDANLTACDHTTRLTKAFLQAEQCDVGIVLPWLAEQGGCCDCEALANLDDLDEILQSPPRHAVPAGASDKPSAKQQRTSRSLQTAAGWDLSKLPAPWRITNLYVADQPLQIQLGKKSGCTIQIVEAPLLAGDRTSDDYWSNLWYARTELPAKGPLQVERGVLKLPKGLESLLVRSPHWTPVYCWIVPESDDWYLEVQTESNRYRGDFPQIAALIAILS